MAAIALAAWAQAGPARADDWQVMLLEGSKTAVSVDLWVLTSSRDTRSGRLAFINDDFTYDLVDAQIDCRRRSWSLSNPTRYDELGQTASSSGNVRDIGRSNIQAAVTRICAQTMEHRHLPSYQLDHHVKSVWDTYLGPWPAGRLTLQTRPPLTGQWRAIGYSANRFYALNVAAITSATAGSPVKRAWIVDAPFEAEILFVTQTEFDCARQAYRELGTLAIGRDTGVATEVHPGQKTFSHTGSQGVHRAGWYAVCESPPSGPESFPSAAAFARGISPSFRDNERTVWHGQ